MSASDAADAGGSALGDVGKGIGGAGGILGGVDILEGNGLDRAEAAAGEVLRGIFGGLPWEMSPGEIVRAVVPDFIENLAGGSAEGANEAAGMLVPYLMDVLPVVV